ncbi:hypothetical protein [Clostridium sp. C8-1-8]|uniref:hypothetical protein n=1 Tax=Clostridium sp. C8-1-8 TaxID=2698831 RepID=UPI001370DB34|nr:hypothetical protein [Clostridium sp. C8-1-8]
MNIKDNVLRKYLENVYIIGGNACSGKSTMAKLIAEKYGFTLYQMDEHYEEHRKMANETDQPNMCYPRDDIYAFFNRPVLEYASSLQGAIKEEVPMVLLDLIELQKDKPVIADVLFTPMDIEGVIPRDRAVFLTSNRELVESDYFNRPEKRDFYDCVMSFPNPEASFENVFNVVDLINQREKAIIEASGYYSIERKIDSKVLDVVRCIEKHFDL